MDKPAGRGRGTNTSTDKRGVGLHDRLILRAFEFALKATPPWSVPLPDRSNVKLCKESEFAAILQAASGSGSADQLRATRQLYALVTKSDNYTDVTPSDRKTACINKFNAVQKRNKRHEKRLKHYLHHWSRIDPLVQQVLATAQLDIFRLLGVGPSDEDLGVFLAAKPFSVGVVQGLKSTLYASRSGRRYTAKDTNAYGKLNPDNTLTTTGPCLRVFGHALLNGAYGRYLDALGKGLKGSIVDYSEGTVVPKDAVIDRFIAIEPLLNAMAQQGIAAMLVPYLRRWHINLDDQSKNRELACRASRIGFAPNGWATIDLSSASDTILTVLVEYLLPRRWFEWLDAARTTRVMLDGTYVADYASFSTMGNAFTFPLQCLIFGALTRAVMKITDCADREYRVYGDDIIAPIPASGLLLQVLRFSGFMPNVEKTFVIGSFRESCGGDFLDGDDVRPIFLRESVDVASVRHVYFNGLQRSLPAHPTLCELLEAEKSPLVGPMTDINNPESRWYEAPRERWSRFMVSPGRQQRPAVIWDGLAVSNGKIGKFKRTNVHVNYQAAVYRIPGICVHPKKIQRVDVPRALLASLAGSPGECHDLRGVVKHRVRDSVVIGASQPPRISPYWY